MKKVFAILVSLGCLLCLVGCGGGDLPEASTGGSTQEAMDYTPFLCPWNTDVVAKAREDGKLHYYFMTAEELFDGRWGDSCLMVFPDGTTLLMDSGVKNYGPLLLLNLQRMGVTKLDYILITHPHSDHQNGVFHPDNLETGVLGQIPVGKVFFAKIVTTGRDDHSYVENACQAKGIDYEILEKGATVQLTRQVSMEVLWPQEGTKDMVFETEQYNLLGNQNSMVTRFDFGEHSALFAADLHKLGELQCLSQNGADKRKADLLKAPHHGQDTSSAPEFVAAVGAQVAVATGRATVKDETRQTYELVNTKLLDDRTYGYIHIEADEAGQLTYETSRS